MFGLPMASPLFAAGADQDTGLPACCRRNGAHHCSIATATGRSQGTQIAALREKCPAYPATTTLIRHNDVSLLVASPLFSQQPARAVDALPLAFLTPDALDRSRHERGPPTLRS